MFVRLRIYTETRSDPISVPANQRVSGERFFSGVCRLIYFYFSFFRGEFNDQGGVGHFIIHWNSLKVRVLGEQIIYCT